MLHCIHHVMLQFYFVSAESLLCVDLWYKLLRLTVLVWVLRLGQLWNFSWTMTTWLLNSLFKFFVSGRWTLAIRENGTIFPLTTRDCTLVQSIRVESPFEPWHTRLSPVLCIASLRAIVNWHLEGMSLNKIWAILFKCKVVRVILPSLLAVKPYFVVCTVIKCLQNIWFALFLNCLV